MPYSRVQAVVASQSARRHDRIKTSRAGRVAVTATAGRGLYGPAQYDAARPPPPSRLTPSELSFTLREALLSFGPHTHHDPVGRCVATIDLRITRVRLQGRTRDHR